MSLLEKGLNFEVTPPNIPTTETVIKVESAITKLVHEKARRKYRRNSKQFSVKNNTTYAQHHERNTKYP